MISNSKKRRKLLIGYDIEIFLFIYLIHFSGNLIIDIFSEGFKLKDNDEVTTTCLKKTNISKLEVLISDIETLDYRNLVWILSFSYPRSQCRLVIYLFSYFLTLKRFSARAIQDPHRGSANSLYYFWIFCFFIYLNHVCRR